MKRISILLILCLIMSYGTGIIASAEEYAVNPRYSNLTSYACDFTITNDVASATVFVRGYEGVTNRITVNVKLEKRALLGLIWNDVEEWNSSATNYRQNFTFTKSVGSGTYRCSFEITVEGNNGGADVITDQKTVKN